MQEYAIAGSIAEEIFSSIRTVLAFGGAGKEKDRYVGNLATARKINIRKGNVRLCLPLETILTQKTLNSLAFFSGLGFGMLWFFIYASYALAFWFGVGLVINEADTGYSAGGMMTVSVILVERFASVSHSYPMILGIFLRNDGIDEFKYVSPVHRVIWNC